MMMMDADQLIAAITVRTPLWDKKNICYRNRIVVEKKWKEISNEMKMSSEHLKRRWKQLRDQFRIELKKIPPEECEDLDNTYKSYTSWPYFKSMYFLKDQMKSRTSTRYIQPKERKETQVETFERNSEDESQLLDCDRSDNFDDENTMDTIDMPKSSTTRNGQSKSKDEANYNMKIIKKKLRTIERKQSSSKWERDEDEAFFESLLPHVRKLKPAQKLIFRTRIQNFVLDHVYKTSPEDVQVDTHHSNTRSQSSTLPCPIPEISAVSECSFVDETDQSFSLKYEQE